MPIAELSPEMKAEHEAYKKREAQQDAILERLKNALTEEERKAIHPDVWQRATSNWSPASRNLAFGVLRKAIGEDIKMIKYESERYIKFYEENPEINF